MRKFSFLTVFFLLSGIFLLPLQVEARGGFLRLAAQSVIARSFSVSLASDTPVGVNVVQGAKDVPVLKLNFRSQGQEKAILQRLVLSRFGVSQDSDIERAYLYDMSDNLLATGVYLSGRYVFSDVGLVVGSDVKSLMVKVDLAEDATDAGTFGMQVPSKLSVLTAGARTGLRFPINGSFPLKGSEFTIVSRAEPELNVFKNAAYPDQLFIPGQTNFKLGSFVLEAGAGENIVITSIALMVDVGDDDRGSPQNDTKITNLKLFQAGGNPDGSNKQIGVTQSLVWDYVASGFTARDLVLGRNELTVFDVYGDIHSSLFDDVVVKIPPGAVFAYGEETQFSIVAPDEWVDLQKASAVASGILTVKTAAGNPPAKQFVAGTGHSNPENEIYRLELSASPVEDFFVNELVFRLDAVEDDVAVRELALYDERGSFLAATPLVDNGDFPGSFRFTFAGEDRIKVPAGETLVLGVRASFTSSNQAAVSGKTPQIHVVSVEAVGIDEVIPYIGDGFVDSTANLDAGLDDSGCNLNQPAGINSTQTTFQIDNGGAGICSLETVPAGILLTVDSEDMLILGYSGNIFTVVRGMNNTVPATHADNAQFNYGGMAADQRSNVVSVDNATVIKSGQIIRLGFENMEVAFIRGDLLFVARAVNNSFLEGHTINDEAVMEAVALESNEMMVMETLPLITAALDSPAGGCCNTAKRDDVLAKFVVTAENNPADPGQNRVAVARLRITPNTIGMSLYHLQLYPAERDNNQVYAIPAEWKGANLVEFDLSKDPDVLAGRYDEVLEGTSKSFVLRGSTNANTNGTYQMKIRPLGSGRDAVYGFSSNFEWSDGVTTTAWVDQPGGEAVLNSMALGFVAHGVVDTTVPVITSVVFGGVANNALGVSDTITISFSEAMSPGTLAEEVSAELRPDNLNIQVKEGGTADVSLATTGVVSVKNLFSVDVDAQNAASQSEYSILVKLNSASSLLTLTLAALTQGSGMLGSAEELGFDGIQAGGFAFDQAGNAMPSGTIPNAVIMGDI